MTGFIWVPALGMEDWLQSEAALAAVPSATANTGNVKVTGWQTDYPSNPNGTSRTLDLPALNLKTYPDSVILHSTYDGLLTRTGLSNSHFRKEKARHITRHPQAMFTLQRALLTHVLHCHKEQLEHCSMQAMRKPGARLESQFHAMVLCHMENFWGQCSIMRHDLCSSTVGRRGSHVKSKPEKANEPTTVLHLQQTRHEG